MIKYALLLLLFTVTGCSLTSERSQTPNEAGAERALADESFLINSGNYTRLISLYKEQLKSNDQPEIRVKLTKAYLDTQDNESALFTIAPVMTLASVGAEPFYLQGLAQFNLGNIEQAERSLSIAAHKAFDNAKIINLLGAVQAELGKLTQARESFNRARSLLYDDVVIKNNLALVDIMEGKYQDAAARLMPIYRSDPNGADQQLKANLAIAAAKLGSFETLKLLYGHQYSDVELFGIFQGLRASTYVPSLTEQSRSDQRLLGKATSKGDIQWQNKRTVSPIELSNPSEFPAVSAATELPQENRSEAHQVTQPRPTMAMAEPKSIVSYSDTKNNSKLEQRKDDLIQSSIFSPPISTDEEQNEKSRSSTRSLPSTQENHQTFENLVGIKRHYSSNVLTSVPPTQSLESPKATATEETELELSLSPIPSAITEQGGGSFINNPVSTPINVQWPFPAINLAPETLMSQEDIDVPFIAEPVNDVAILEEQADKVEETGGNIPVKPKKKWNFVPLEQYSLITSDGLDIPVAQFRHSGQLIDVQ